MTGPSPQAVPVPAGSQPLPVQPVGAPPPLLKYTKKLTLPAAAVVEPVNDAVAVMVSPAVPFQSVTLRDSAAPWAGSAPARKLQRGRGRSACWDAAATLALSRPVLDHAGHYG